MTKYERIVRTVNRRVVAEWVNAQELYVVKIKGRFRVFTIFALVTDHDLADHYRDDIRAAFIADMCRIANVKPPKARK